MGRPQFQAGTPGRRCTLHSAGLSETLQPPSVDLHVFGCPFDVHDLPQATLARYLAQPALPRRPRRVLSSVLRPPVGRSPVGVALGTFTAPLAASGHAPDPETLSAPYLGRAEKTHKVSDVHTQYPGMGRWQPAPRHTRTLKRSREAARRPLHSTSIQGAPYRWLINLDAPVDPGRG